VGERVELIRRKSGGGCLIKIDLLKARSEYLKGGGCRWGTSRWKRLNSFWGPTTKVSYRDQEKSRMRVLLEKTGDGDEPE